jgi:hypothetical protein
MPDYPNRNNPPPTQTMAINMLAAPRHKYTRFQEPPPPKYKRYTSQPANSHFYSALATPNRFKLSERAIEKMSQTQMMQTLPASPAKQEAAPADASSPAAAAVPASSPAPPAQ